MICGYLSVYTSVPLLFFDGSNCSEVKKVAHDVTIVGYFFAAILMLFGLCSGTSKLFFRALAAAAVLAVMAPFMLYILILVGIVNGLTIVMLPIYIFGYHLYKKNTIVRVNPGSGTPFQDVQMDPPASKYPVHLECSTHGLI
jgi:hypothetical protein